MKKTVILISGKKRTGKNALADYITEAAKEMGLTVWQGLFAGPLKDACRQDFAPLAAFLKAEHARLVGHGIPPEEIPWMDVQDEQFYEAKTPLTRILLQVYGTQIFRDRVDKDYWTKKMVESLDRQEAEVLLITDTRFPNEVLLPTEWAEARDYRSCCVRVHREVSRDAQGEHESETALDDFAVWDHVVRNDGPLADLKRHAREVLYGALSREPQHPGDYLAEMPC